MAELVIKEPLKREDIADFDGINSGLDDVIYKMERILKLKEKLAKLSPSEAIYGFTAWLTTRDETLTIGAKHDCSLIPALIDAFCEANSLEKVTSNYPKNLVHPD